MKTVFQLKKGSTILVLSTISIFGFSESGVMQHPSTTDLKTAAQVRNRLTGSIPN